MASGLKKTVAVISAAGMLAVAGFFTMDGLLATGSGASGRVASLLHLKNETIAVPDQEVSASVRIGMAALTSAGFVAVYDDEEGPGKLLGVSQRLPKGVARDLSIPLQQPLAAGYYYAMLRHDDGDGVFDPQKDAPSRDARGTVVMTRFLVSTGE